MATTKGKFKAGVEGRERPEREASPEDVQQSRKRERELSFEPSSAQEADVDADHPREYRAPIKKTRRLDALVHSPGGSLNGSKRASPILESDKSSDSEESAGGKGSPPADGGGSPTAKDVPEGGTLKQIREKVGDLVLPATGSTSGPKVPSMSAAEPASSSEPRDDDDVPDASEPKLVRQLTKRVEDLKTTDSVEAETAQSSTAIRGSSPMDTTETTTLGDVKESTSTAPGEVAKTAPAPSNKDDGMGLSRETSAHPADMDDVRALQTAQVDTGATPLQAPSEPAATIGRQPSNSPPHTTARQSQSPPRLSKLSPQSSPKRRDRINSVDSTGAPEDVPLQGPRKRKISSEREDDDDVERAAAERKRARDEGSPQAESSTEGGPTKSAQTETIPPVSASEAGKSQFDTTSAPATEKKPFINGFAAFSGMGNAFALVKPSADSLFALPTTKEPPKSPPVTFASFSGLNPYDLIKSRGGESLDSMPRLSPFGAKSGSSVFDEGRPSSSAGAKAAFGAGESFFGSGGPLAGTRAPAFGAAEYSLSSSPSKDSPFTYVPPNDDYEPRETSAIERRGGNTSLGDNLKGKPSERVFTGEEDEVTKASSRVKLFYNVKGQWKERGVGVVKLNVRPTDSRARIIMRTDAVFKILLNMYLFRGMSTETIGGGRMLQLVFIESGEIVMYMLKFGGKDAATNFTDEMRLLVPLQPTSLAKIDKPTMEDCSELSKEMTSTSKLPATISEDRSTGDSKEATPTAESNKADEGPESDDGEGEDKPNKDEDEDADAGEDEDEDNSDDGDGGEEPEAKKLETGTETGGPPEMQEAATAAADSVATEADLGTDVPNAAAPPLNALKKTSIGFLMGDSQDPKESAIDAGWGASTKESPFVSVEKMGPI